MSEGSVISDIMGTCDEEMMRNQNIMLKLSLCTSRKYKLVVYTSTS